MVSFGVMFVCLAGVVMGTSALPGAMSDYHGLEFLGATATKELYITKNRTATFQYALGFGCPYVFNNLTLASIETLEELDLVDRYFAATQPVKDRAEPVWTSGVDRLGSVRQWASSGKTIERYPTSFQGDWQPGQESAPAFADYNCVALWRYCDKQSHGATIPSCSWTPHGTWFTPRPCYEERRFICEKSI